MSVAVQVSSKSTTSILMAGGGPVPGWALKKATSICIAVLYSFRKVPAKVLAVSSHVCIYGDAIVAACNTFSDSLHESFGTL